MGFFKRGEKETVQQEEILAVPDVVTEIPSKKEPEKETTGLLRLDLLRADDFGPLLPYVQDKNVTDINWDGSILWIRDLVKGEYASDIVLDRRFVNIFTSKLSNVVSKPFNKYNPVLESETDTLRISVMHEDVADTGRTISIRNIPLGRRLTKEYMLETNYCTEEVEDLLSTCVDAEMNIAVCGLPGSGKTELVKYLTKNIPKNRKVITIEDTLELHYKQINPESNCVSLKINEQFGYVEALKAVLRHLPRWVLLSEVRSVEVKHLLECLSSGSHCMTTLHSDEARLIPDRIKSMVGDLTLTDRVESDVFSYLNVGVYIYYYEDEHGRPQRNIDQICFFSREGGKNVTTILYDRGEWLTKDIQPALKRKFDRLGRLPKVLM